VLGPLICYEDVVIGIPRAMTRAGAQILFNILNDAWFGDTAGPHEHLQLALWRAVENRRYLLRSSNSGITSVVDPLGRITAQLPTFREDVLVATVQPLSLMSFYTRYGDLFAWLLVIASVALVLTSSRPGASSETPG
jgi:apolipoprotein N-acyltransferase